MFDSATPAPRQPWRPVDRWCCKAETECRFLDKSRSPGCGPRCARSSLACGRRDSRSPCPHAVAPHPAGHNPRPNCPRPRSGSEPDGTPRRYPGAHVPRWHRAASKGTRCPHLQQKQSRTDSLRAAATALRRLERQSRAHCSHPDRLRHSRKTSTIASPPRSSCALPAFRPSRSPGLRPVRPIACHSGPVGLANPPRAFHQQLGRDGGAFQELTNGAVSESLPLRPADPAFIVAQNNPSEN